MHAWEAHELELPDDEWDAPAKGEEWTEEASERFELAQASRLARLLVAQRGDPAAGVAERLNIGDEEIAALARVNRDPDLILDDVSELLVVPVDADDLVLAGAPNGYFPSDLEVLENHTIAWHLQQRFGYRFFGEGASWLGYDREEALSAAEAIEVVDELRSIYATAESQAWGEVADALTGSSILLLGYTDNFADL